MEVINENKAETMETSKHTRKELPEDMEGKAVAVEGVLDTARRCVSALQDTCTFNDGVSLLLSLAEESDGTVDLVTSLPVGHVQEFGVALHDAADALLLHLNEPSEQSQEIVRGLTFILQTLRGYTQVQVAQAATGLNVQLSKEDKQLAAIQAQIDRMGALEEKFDLAPQQVFDALANIMRSHLADANVQNDAFNMLFRFIRKKTPSEDVTVAILEQILEAMREHPSKNGIQRNGHSLVRHFIWSVPEEIQIDAVDFLLRPFLLRPVDLVAVDLACSVFTHNFSHELVKVGVVDVILTFLSMEPSHSEIRGCFDVLRPTHDVSSEVLALKEVGVDEKLVNIMKKSSFRGMQNCSELLAVFAIDTESAATILRLGAADCIVQKLPETDENNFYHLELLLNLAWNTSNQLALVKMGAADMILDILAKHKYETYDERRFGSLCCAVLYNLSLAPGVSAQLRKKGTRKSLRKLKFAFGGVDVVKKLSAKLSRWSNANNARPVYVNPIDGSVEFR